MVITSDETQIQIFANWPMSHAKRVTRVNRKNPEYRVVAAIRKLQTDTNCLAGKSWPNHVKNEQHIGSEKTYGPKNTEQLNIMMHNDLRSSPSAYSGFVNISPPAEYSTACYTVLKRPNKVETAVHGCNLAFSLDFIVSFPR